MKFIIEGSFDNDDFVKGFFKDEITTLLKGYECRNVKIKVRKYDKRRLHKTKGTDSSAEGNCH